MKIFQLICWSFVLIINIVMCRRFPKQVKKNLADWHGEFIDKYAGKH